MTPHEIRLAVLKLCVPQGIANPDVDLIIRNAKALEAYVNGAGHAERPPQNAGTPLRQDRTPLPLQGPARK